MRARVRDEAADRPGVYRMIAADGEIVYVGKSKRVRSRLLSYFRCAFPEEKGARILRDADRIEWEYTPSEFAALLGELRLIKQFRPRFNVAMKRDGRNYCFIKITKGPAPRLVVVRGPGQDDSAIYYGPFYGRDRRRRSSSRAQRRARLARLFGGSAMNFADQPELFESFRANARVHSLRDQQMPRSMCRRLLGPPVRRAARAGARISRRRRRWAARAPARRDGTGERATGVSSARRCCATN